MLKEDLDEMEKQTLIKIYDALFKLRLIKHLPNDCHVEHILENSYIKRMHRLCSQNEKEGGREGE